MALIFDKLINTYSRSQIPNHVKFEFVLHLFRFVLQKAPILFGIMTCTNEIQDNQNFLRWFVMKELRFENQQEIIEVYLSNKYALEFLLLMMLYNIYFFPNMAQELAGLMRSVNLL